MRFDRFVKWLAVRVILFVSVFFRTLGIRGCRFSPSCSAYAVHAFQTLGFFRACRVTLGRLARCQPFSAGGHDPLHS